MITHGNKQISEIVYARKSSEGGGAVRLTNIIRGAQVVFGGLGPSSGWLNGTTTGAILAAFGQTDGKAVIKETNAYLNALAATDKTKASALVGFINEDPMLVCSLGLQPQGVEMPIRFIHGGYTNQVSTGIVPTTTMVINAKFRMNSVTKYHPVFQQGYISESAMTTRCIAVNGASNKFTFTFCGKTSGGKSIAVTFDYNVSGRWMDMQMNDAQVIVNGTTYAYTGTDRGSKNNNPIWLLGRGDSYGAEDIDIQLFQTIDGDSKHTFVPFKDGQTCYIIDIESWNKIEGSFSIAYTLPDGTPWTPLNQTP